MPDRPVKRRNEPDLVELLGVLIVLRWPALMLVMFGLALAALRLLGPPAGVAPP